MRSVEKYKQKMDSLVKTEKDKKQKSGTHFTSQLFKKKRIKIAQYIIRRVNFVLGYSNKKNTNWLKYFRSHFVVPLNERARRKVDMLR